MAIATQRAGKRVVLVVSAMSGETNRLLALAHDIAKVPDAREMDAIAATGEQVSAALTAMAIHAEVAPSQQSHVAMVPNMRFWNVNGYSDVAPNFDLAYQFDSGAKWKPYLGGGVGLNFVHNKSTDHTNTDPGVNMLGGVRFPGEGNHYFVEGRFTASDVNQVAVLTGITFHAR